MIDFQSKAVQAKGQLKDIFEVLGGRILTGQHSITCQMSFKNEDVMETFLEKKS